MSLNGYVFIFQFKFELSLSFLLNMPPRKNAKRKMEENSSHVGEDKSTAKTKKIKPGKITFINFIYSFNNS